MKGCRTIPNWVLVVVVMLAFSGFASAQKAYDQVSIPGDTLVMVTYQPPFVDENAGERETPEPSLSLSDVTIYGIRKCRYFVKTQNHEVTTTVVTFKVNRKNLRRFKAGFENQFDKPEISNDWTTNHRKVNTNIFWMMEVDEGRQIRGHLVKEGKTLTFELKLQEEKTEKN